MDRVWSGHVTMRDVVTIKMSAFRTSGSMKLIRKVIIQGSFWTLLAYFLFKHYSFLKLFHYNVYVGIKIQSFVIRM